LIPKNDDSFLNILVIIWLFRNAMSVAPFTAEVVLVCLVTLYVLHQYGNLRKQHYIVTGAVFISWFFSFLIIFVLPLDVSSVSIFLFLFT
jgi:hypothetical protein